MYSIIVKSNFQFFKSRNSFYMESFVISLISLPIIMTVLVAIRDGVVLEV